MPKTLFSFFEKRGPRTTNATAPPAAAAAAAVPPPPQPQPDVDDGSIAARASAAPDAVPSAAAAVKEVHDVSMEDEEDEDEMEVDELEDDLAAVMPYQDDAGVVADRKLPAGLKNEADEGDGVEAGEVEATSPGCKHDRDELVEKPRGKRQRAESKDDDDDRTPVAAFACAASARSANCWDETDDEYDDEEGVPPSAQKGQLLEYGRDAVDEGDLKPAANPENETERNEPDGAGRKGPRHVPGRAPKYDDETLQSLEVYEQALIDGHTGRHERLGGLGCRFGVLYDDSFYTSEQKAAYDKMIDMFLKALAIIDGNNEIADWSSPVAHYFNALHEAFSVDDGNGYIYINGKASIYVYPEEDDPDDGDDGDKVGGASVGSTRTVGYVKKLQKKLLKAWKAAKTPEERAKLKRKITAVDVALKKVIDFDNLLEETQRKFNEYVMSRLSEFACDFFPTTIADLLYLDRQGVSVQAQVYFYSLLMDLDDPMGGADAIKGYKRRLFLNILETAVTAWLRRKGHKLRNSSCLDEWLHGRGFLGRGLKKRRNIKSDFVNHMRAGFRPAVLERIGKQKMTVDVVMMSWDVPKIVGQPEMFRHGKVMVAENEHGVGNYENAFTTPASNLPDPDENGCYHVKSELRYDPKFTDEQCRVARERNIAKVRVCERTGVLTSIDKNDKAWLDNCGTTFVDYLTKTHVPDPAVFGDQPSSFKWAVAFNYKGIYMMELEYDGDDLIRVVVIFCPWCNMFFSKVGTKASAERLASMEFTADSAQFYHELMCHFCTENASLLPSTSKLSLSDGYRRAQMHHQRGLDSDVNFLVR